MVCVGNFGGPPSINLRAEIISIGCSIRYSQATSVLLAGLTFLALGYTLVVYASPGQGRTTSASKLPLPPSPRAMSVFGLHIYYLLAAYI